MFSRPTKYSASNSNEYQDIINSFNLSISSNGIENILDKLQNNINFYEKCPTCQAILNKNLIQAPEKGEKGKMKCKFCENSLEFSSSQLQQINYMNENSENYLNIDEEDMKGKASTSVLIIICLDYSGSMNVSYVPQENSLGKSFLREKPIPNEYKEFIKEYSDITRKELLLVNLKKQLQNLFELNSKYNYQIFVITFASDIIMYGNGSQKKSIRLDPKFFSDMKKCIEFGKENALNVFNQNKDSDINYLFETLKEQEADGMTSLGPAIACGLGAIKAIKPDLCQFYVFTDGVANLGIGDMGNESEAKEIYSQLANIGLDYGVIFHVIGFGNENSKLNILQMLTDNSADGKLQRIQTPILREGRNEKIYSYDEEGLKKLLREALTVSAKTYGILLTLKIYSMKNVEVEFCKDCAKYVDSKKKGESFYKTKIGNISEEPNHVSCKYKIKKGELSSGDIIPFQFHLNFTKAKTGEKVFIIINVSSEINKRINFDDEIDLKTCNTILMNDNFEKSDLFEQFINFLYETKHKSKNNKTANKAEKDMKEFIGEKKPKKIKAYQKMFDEYEKQIISRIEKEKETNELKLKEAEALKKKKSEDQQKKPEAEALKIKKTEDQPKKPDDFKVICESSDSDEDDDDRTITIKCMKKKIQNEANIKEVEEKEEEKDEKTLKKKKYEKKSFEDEEEKTFQGKNKYEKK